MTGISLTDYLAKLTYAAGEGADHIQQSVTSTANTQARTGLPVRSPGPALKSILQGAQAQGVTPANPELAHRALNRMAKSTLRQGAELLGDGS